MSVSTNITVQERIEKQHGTAVSMAKKPAMFEKILVCPNCTSLLKTWYQSTVTRTTCPECWAEIALNGPEATRLGDLWDTALNSCQEAV